MSTITVSFADVEPVQSNAVPRGTYNVVVEQIEMRESQSSDSSYLYFTLEIEDGEQAGRNLYAVASFSVKALPFTMATLNSFGLDEDEISFEVDDDSGLVTDPDLTGARAIAKVTNKLYEGNVQARVTSLRGVTEDEEEEEEGEEEEVKPKRGRAKAAKPTSRNSRAKAKVEDDDEEDEEEEEEEVEEAPKATRRGRTAAKAKPAAKDDEDDDEDEEEEDEEEEDEEPKKVNAFNRRRGAAAAKPAAKPAARTATRKPATTATRRAASKTTRRFK